MDTERYCASLDAVDRIDAIRAVHQAYLHLSALDSNVDCEHFDNEPALEALANVLRTAGHMGFVK